MPGFRTTSRPWPASRSRTGPAAPRPCSSTATEAGVDVSLSDRAGWAVCLVGTGGAGWAATWRSSSRGHRHSWPTSSPRPSRTYVAARPSADHDAAANLIWSAKESGLKVLRTGLRRDTRSVEVVVGEAGRRDRLGQARRAHGRGRRPARLVAPGRVLPDDGGRRGPLAGAAGARRVRRPRDARCPCTAGWRPGPSEPRRSGSGVTPAPARVRARR